MMYQQAYNSDQKLISIENVDKSNRYEGYSCLGCGNELIPRLGEVKVHHFAHKHDCECKPETYLHKLAKTTFYKNYITSLQKREKFLLQILINKECHHYEHSYGVSCKLTDQSDWVDLINFFPKIELEKRDGEFIPDILLSNDKDEKLYVEFAVTHESDELKIESGRKIIEFKLSSEKDLNLFNKNKIYTLSNPEKIKTYNFNITTKTGNCNGKCEAKYESFFVFKSGKAKMLKMSLEEYNSKRIHQKPIYSELLHRLNEDEFTIEDIFEDNGNNYIKSNFIHNVISCQKKGIKIKNCFLCRYHSQNNHMGGHTPDFGNSIFCKLLKEKGNSNKAANCKYYRIDNNAYEQYLQEEY